MVTITKCLYIDSIHKPKMQLPDMHFAFTGNKCLTIFTKNKIVGEEVNMCIIICLILTYAALQVIETSEYLKEILKMKLLLNQLLRLRSLNHSCQRLA